MTTDWREYRKTATVYARRVNREEALDVQTLEGPATAQPGDYICRANTEVGEQWVIRGDIFESTYELIE